MRNVLILIFALSLVHSFGQKPLGRPLVSNIDEEIAPYISANGQAMAMMIKDTPTHKFLIHYAVKQGGQWTRPVEIDAINKQPKLLLKGSFCLSENGQEIYYSSKQYPNVGDYDIWYSKRQPNGSWTSPENIGKPVNSDMADVFPSLSTDGKELYFARSLKKSGTQEYGGCSQLMVSRRVGDRWSSPRALESLNKGCETAPRILADNSTLLFASKRGGKKDFDLFLARKNDQAEWSDIKPFAPINSPEDEVYASIGANHSLLYYSKKGPHTMDLFRYKIRDEAMQPTPVHIYRFKMKSPKGEQTLVIYDVEKTRTVSKSQINGNDYANYYLSIGKFYDASVMKKGYFYAAHHLDLREEQGFGVKNLQVTLDPVSSKKGYDLQLVLRDTFELHEPLSIPEMRRAARQINEYSGNVKLVGDFTVLPPPPPPAIDTAAADSVMIIVDSSEIVIEVEELGAIKIDEDELFLMDIYNGIKSDLKSPQNFSFEIRRTETSELELPKFQLFFE